MAPKKHSPTNQFSKECRACRVAVNPPYTRGTVILPVPYTPYILRLYQTLRLGDLFYNCATMATEISTFVSKTKSQPAGGLGGAAPPLAAPAARLRTRFADK